MTKLTGVQRVHTSEHEDTRRAVLPLLCAKAILEEGEIENDRLSEILRERYGLHATPEEIARTKEIPDFRIALASYLEISTVRLRAEIYKVCEEALRQLSDQLEAGALKPKDLIQLVKLAQVPTAVVATQAKQAAGGRARMALAK